MDDYFNNIFIDPNRGKKNEYKLFESNDIARYGLFHYENGRDAVLNPMVCKGLLYLIWKALQEGEPTGYMSYQVEMTVREFGEALGFSRSDKSHNFAKDVKRVINLLFTMTHDRFIIYDSSQDIRDYIWITPLEHLNVDYKHDKLKVNINEDVRNYFGQSNGNFTVVKLKYLNRLRKTSAVILYPYFCRYLNLGTVHCKVSELKKLLTGKDDDVLDDVQYRYIKRDYLNPAINEINDKTDIEIHYHEEKDGKRVETLEFNITKAPALDEIENYLYYNNMRPKEYIPEEYNDKWMEDYMYFMSSQKYVCINAGHTVNIVPVVKNIPDDSSDEDDDEGVDIIYVDDGN